MSSTIPLLSPEKWKNQNSHDASFFRVDTNAETLFEPNSAAHANFAESPVIDTLPSSTIVPLNVLPLSSHGRIVHEGKPSLEEVQGNGMEAELKPHIQRLIHVMLSNPSIKRKSHDVAIHSEVVSKTISSGTNSSTDSREMEMSTSSSTNALIPSISLRNSLNLQLDVGNKYPTNLSADNQTSKGVLSPGLVEKHITPHLLGHNRSHALEKRLSPDNNAESSNSLVQDMNMRKPTDLNESRQQVTPSLEFSETNPIPVHNSVVRSISAPGGAKYVYNGPEETIADFDERLEKRAISNGAKVLDPLGQADSKYSNPKPVIKYDGMEAAGCESKTVLDDKKLDFPVLTSSMTKSTAANTATTITTTTTTTTATSRAFILEPEALMNQEKTDDVTSAVSSSQNVWIGPKDGLASHYQGLHVRMEQKLQNESFLAANDVRRSESSVNPVESAEEILNTVARFAQAGEFVASSAERKVSSFKSLKCGKSPVLNISVAEENTSSSSQKSTEVIGKMEPLYINEEPGDYVELATPAVLALMSSRGSSDCDTSLVSPISRIKDDVVSNSSLTECVSSGVEDFDPEMFKALQHRTDARIAPSLSDDAVLRAKSIGVTSGAFLAHAPQSSDHGKNSWIVKPSSLEGAVNASSIYNEEELKMLLKDTQKTTSSLNNSPNLLKHHLKESLEEIATSSTATTNSPNELVLANRRVAVKRGVDFGLSAEREVAAYLLDHEGFAGVPPTYMYVASSEVVRESTNSSTNVSVSFQIKAGANAIPLAEQVAKKIGETTTNPMVGASSYPRASAALIQLESNSSITDSSNELHFSPQSKADEVETRKLSNTATFTRGSVQKFIPNVGSGDDMFIGGMPIHKDEVHKIGILDIRLLNLDRHSGNIIVTRTESNGEMKLVPIDHSYILPSIRDMSDVRFDWVYFEQAKQPFSKKSLSYIMRLDPIADAMQLRWLGFSNEAVLSSLVSTILLQRSAQAGLNLAEIGNMVQRIDFDYPSELEKIVAIAFANTQLQTEMTISSNLDGSPSKAANLFEIDLSPLHASHKSEDLGTPEFPSLYETKQSEQVSGPSELDNLEKDYEKALTPPQLERSATSTQRINELYSRVANIQLESVEDAAESKDQGDSTPLSSALSISSVDRIIEDIPKDIAKDGVAVDGEALEAAEQWLVNFLANAVEQMDVTIQEILKRRNEEL